MTGQTSRKQRRLQRPSSLAPLWFTFCLFTVSLGFAQNSSTLSSQNSEPQTQQNAEQLKNIIYQADIIQADLDRESAVLKGNVVIMFDGYQLFAREAEVFRKDNRFTASGDVRIESVQTQITAEEVEIYFDNKHGKLKKARLVSGQMLFEADEIKKIGKDVFEAKDASFTTCLTCPPSWRFKASKLTTNVNKYVDIQNGYLQVVNQSLLWLPRIILPVNTRRKSGIIQPKPHFSFARRQADIEFGYFWAISDNKDLTITPKLYTRSGIKGLANYRHLLSPDSHLELTTGYMKDHYFSEYDFTSNTESFSTRHRWFVDFKNKFELPGNFTQKSNIKLTEDLLYVSDFPGELPGHKEPALVNQVGLIKNKDSSHFSTEIIYNINLLTEDMTSKNLASVHKAPVIKYSILNTPFLKDSLNYSFDTEYIKFTRRENSYDEIISTGGTNPPREVNPTPVGQYNPATDLIRSGNRIILRPEVSTSVNLGNFLRIEPEARYHQALYSFDPQTSIEDPTAPYNNFAQMGYVEGEVRFKSQVAKVLNPRWKHILEPQIRFVRGEILGQTDHIFFRSTRGMPYHRRFQPITDTDFFDFEHGLQFDYQDRIYDTNIIEFSLLQSFLRKNHNSGVTYYDQPVFFDLVQSYDFLHAKTNNPDPWSNLNALLKVKSKRFETFTHVSHFHKIAETNISTRNKFIYKQGHFVEASYKNAYIVDRNNSINFHQEFVGAGLGWEFPYLHLSGGFLYSTLDKQMQGWNLRATILPPGDCWEIYMHIYDNVNRINANRPEVDFNISWNFGDGQSKRPQQTQYMF